MDKRKKLFFQIINGEKKKLFIQIIKENIVLGAGKTVH